MIISREDAERWKFFLNPGCTYKATPTPHTERELLLEFIEATVQGELESRVEDLEGELQKCEEDFRRGEEATEELAEEFANYRDRQKKRLADFRELLKEL